MAAVTTISQQAIETVDLQTVFYNRGVVDADPPYTGAVLPTLTSRYLAGNHLDNAKPSQAVRLGNMLNITHDTQAFISVSGIKWRQYRTLAVSGTYAIVPRSDCESVFIINSAGDTNVTLDLTDATLLPGMTFRFDRPTSVGNLIVTVSNGTIVNPSSGATGTIMTITQYGFVTLRILAGAIPSGPGAFIEESANCTVS